MGKTFDTGCSTIVSSDLVRVAVDLTGHSNTSQCNLDEYPIVFFDEAYQEI